MSWLESNLLWPLTARVARASGLRKMQAVVEKTEDFFPALTEKGRGNPGAHALARMWEGSAETDMTFWWDEMLACMQSHLPAQRAGWLHFGFPAGSVDRLLLSKQTGKPICVCLGSQRGWRASPLLLREGSSVARPPTWGNEISK